MDVAVLQNRGQRRRLGEYPSLSEREYEDAPLASAPVTLSLGADDFRSYTAGETRQVAAELLNAADELARITGA